MTSPAYRGRRISNAEFSRLYADRSLSLVQIGEMLGITEKAVRCRARARGLPIRGNSQKHRRAPAFSSPELPDLWAAGVSASEIARYFGCSNRTIWAAVAERGLPRRGLGWHPRTTLAAWRMARLATETAAALRERDMVDVIAKRMA